MSTPTTRGRAPTVAARPASPSPHVVKSTCSVKANPGNPSSRARAHASSMVDESGVSHDQRVCTWLSAGSILKCHNALRVSSAQPTQPRLQILLEQFEEAPL